MNNNQDRFLTKRKRQQISPSTPPNATFNSDDMYVGEPLTPSLKRTKIERQLFDVSPSSQAGTTSNSFLIGALPVQQPRRKIKSRSIIRYPVYYISPYGNTEPTSTFFINYFLHLAFSLTVLIVGHYFFLVIGAQLIITLFSSIFTLLLTAMLAGLLAFPLAAIGSVLFTNYFQKPQSQQHLFLMLALTNQIVFNVLILAGLSSTYFFALCAVYSVAPLIGLAVLSILPYCDCSTLSPPNVSLSSSGLITPSPPGRLQSLNNDWIAHRHDSSNENDILQGNLRHLSVLGSTPPESSYQRDSNFHLATIYS